MKCLARNGNAIVAAQATEFVKAFMQLREAEEQDEVK